MLFSETSLREAVDWVDRSFGFAGRSNLSIPARGPWIILLLAAIVLLAHSLARYLPRVVDEPVGANLTWRELAAPLLLPMVLTPLILRVTPTGFLPVLVADYLAAHFFVYGLITAICLAFGLRGRAQSWRRGSPTRFMLALSRS